MSVQPTYFADIAPIAFKGADSTDELSYRFYDKDRVVLGKRMEDHLRFAVCFWHTFSWNGLDIFGAPTFGRPWLAGAMDSKAAAWKRAEGFDFIKKLGVPFYCFHDVDVMAAATNAKEHTQYLAEAVDDLERLQGETGIKLLWGTANLFSNPRFMSGGATNPDPEVFAFGALQVRQALEATNRLGGSNYVLWGGREGYETILNTNLKKELDQLGRFLNLVVEHKHKIGFKGTILIEPKPHEPTKHQYDFDTATVFGFLKNYGLEKEVKVNIEANHATLAGHTFEHELAMANALGIFGSIDANRGDHQNGWDTDQFPNSVEEITLAMLEVFRAGGFKDGGFNFDSKVRRQSIDPADLFYGHVGAIDVIAKGLLNAAALIEDGRLDALKKERYAGWDGEIGQAVAKGSLADIADLVLAKDINPKPKSGRQERLENLINRFC
ncbi:MAG TPA: xylose isomerase [Sphingomonas sp.]|uniref:xylose isomerase n=1 Tax=Sphingomonas sp. TaxID=28214 RepID=UPI002C867159|nr:xylose isomerase [Sphingomonas sp.]HMI19102.1 xylose isomerase [Sphingomonas sp.]